MMKNLNLVLVFVATILLVACTKDDVATTASYEAYKAAQPTPIAFSTYLGESATTRAGHAGDITNDNMGTYGFGVFAYYTNDKLYPNTKGASDGTTASALAPNFMYNQQVAYASETTNWTYSPIKYWPNDFNGNSNVVDVRTDGSSAATGSKENYLSFFAYAPYVSASDISGDATKGIIGMSTNHDNGNPVITYKLASSGENVDLLWGTYSAYSSTMTSGTTTNVLNQNNAGGIVQYNDDGNVKDGKVAVNINLQKQKTDGHVGFTFKHALARMTFLVHASPDVDTEIWHANNGGKTLITVKKVVISTPTTYPDGTSAPIQAEFDLATGVWTPSATETGNVAISNYVFHSPKSAAEESATANMVLSLAEPATSPTISTTTNTWQSNGTLNGVPSGGQKTGLYPSSGGLAPIMYIPGSKPCLNITIEYIIRTVDAALATGYSEVSQTISNTVKFANPVEYNKQYSIVMDLGITGVKFSAQVDAWGSSSDTFVNLPLNVTTPQS